jgi:hypothetical protein
MATTDSREEGEMRTLTASLALTAVLATIGATATIAGTQYLIIHTPELYTPAAALEAHRATLTTNCYPPLVVERISTTEIDALPQHGNGDQIATSEEIKSYICEVQSGGDLEYVVLVGNLDHIPVYDGAPWGLLVREWDDWYVDCDDDNLPDVVIGRLPVRTGLEGMEYVAKVIDHDYDSWYLELNEDWRNDLLFLSNDVDNIGGNGRTVAGDRIRGSTEYLIGNLPEAMTECGSVHTGYISEIPLGERHTFAEEKINGGKGVIVSLGTYSHASDLVRFMTYGPEDPLDVDALTNVGQYPVLLGMSCDLGEERWFSGRVSVACSLLIEADRGLIAAMGPTMPTYPQTMVELTSAMLDRLTSTPICGEYAPIGKVLRDLKVEQIQAGGTDRGDLASVRLFGDPALKVPMRSAFIDSLLVNSSDWNPHADQWIQLAADLVDPTFAELDETRYVYRWTTDFGAFHGLGGTAQTWEERVPTMYWHCSDYLDPACASGGTAHLTLQVRELEFPCNVSDTYEFAIEARPGNPPDSPGCPVVLHKSDGQWVEINSILSRKAYEGEPLASEMVEDFIQFTGSPITDPFIPASPWIDVRIDESVDGEYSEIDHLELYAVDHPTGTLFVTTNKGNFYLAEDIVAPDTAWLSIGANVTTELAAVGDSILLTVGEADTVWSVFEDTVGELTTGRPQSIGRTKPELYAAWEDADPGMRVVVEDSTQVSPLYPRRGWSAMIADEFTVTRGDGIDDTVAFALGETHSIDQVALLTDVEEWTNYSLNPVQSASHSDSGDIKVRVLDQDGITSRIEYGQHIECRFDYGHVPSGMEREVVLRVFGTYGRTDQPFTTPPQAQVIPWGFYRVGPNPSVSDVLIAYRVGGDAPYEVSVFDLGGRRIRTLQSGDVRDGVEFVRWDRRDDNGHRVAAGIYFLRLREGRSREAQKLVVLK